jgi:catechol 2,3-dioxygenase-like lactoylglutathione lyase family enzyme
MSVTFSGIDHLALAVNDPDAMAEWFCAVLDYRKRAGQPGGAWLLEGRDGTFLEVMPRDETPRPTRTTWSPGWSHLALRVNNLDNAIARLDAKGVQWAGASGAALGGGRLRNFTDPEGNLWQLVERPTPHGTTGVM